MKIKQEKITLEKLAVMIKNGFDSVDKKFEEARIENEKQHEEIKKELKAEIQILRRDNAKEHEEMKRENSREHEDLKLRQDNSAYRFELVALSERVEKLEKIVVKK